MMLGQVLALLPNATVSIHKISVHHYSISAVAVLRVTFPEPIGMGDGACDFHSLDQKPECANATLGMTRLICNNRALYESHPGHGPYVIPYPEYLISQFTPILLRLPELVNPSPNEYFAILPLLSMDYEGEVTDTGLSMKSNRFSKQCKVRFLSSEQQNYGSKHNLTIGGEVFVGTLPLLPATIPRFVFSKSRVHELRTLLRSRSGAMVPGQAREVCLLELLGGLGNHHEQFQNPVMPLVQSMVEPALEPIAEPIAGVAAASLGATVVPTISMLAVSGISNTLTLDIEPMLTGKLIADITTPVAKKVSDMVHAQFPRKLADALVALVSSKINKTVTEELHSRVSKPMAQQVASSVAMKVGKSLTRNVGHHLIKSVSQALVGTLTVTLAHSPMQDYYCYYCYYHKQYCIYCQYVPEQLEPALYYAGFYSDWYAPYYSETFSDHLGVKIIRQVPTPGETVRALYPDFGKPKSSILTNPVMPDPLLPNQSP